MIRETGKVYEIKSGLALVEVKRSELCQNCPSKAHCSLVADEGIRKVWAENPIGAKQGDMVVIAIGGKKLIKASLLFYVIPLLALFAGAGLGKLISLSGYRLAISGMLGNTLNNILFEADNPSLFLGGFFLLLSFIFIWLWAKGKSKRAEFRPQIIEVLLNEHKE